MLAFIANLFLGAALGSVGGMMGIGGGLLAIPVLAWMYGMDQHLAQGTALVMIVPNLAVGFYRYCQRNSIELKSTALLAALAMLSTYLSARFASRLDPGHLRVAFVLFLTALAGYFSWHAWGRADTLVTQGVVSSRYLPVIGVLSGLISGIFTVGGGLVVPPALVSLFRMTQTKAQGIAMALVLPSTLVALLTFSHIGNVDWHTGVPLALGGITSVSFGVALAHRVAQKTLRKLFCVVLFGTALASLMQH